MPSTHYKLTRKQLRQPDEFQVFVDSARDYVTENWRQLAVSVAAVVAVGAIVLVYYSFERSRDRAIAGRFFTAINALNDKHYSLAEDDFTKLSADDSGRRLGKLSQLYLANAYLQDSNPAKARDTLVAFVADEHDPQFLSLGLNDLAAVYDSMGDYQKAATAYRQAASVAGPGQTKAELGNARMLAKAGDKQGAIAAYRDFLNAHPYAAERQDVLESLAMLGAGPAQAATKTASAAPAASH